MAKRGETALRKWTGVKLSEKCEWSLNGALEESAACGDVGIAEPWVVGIQSTSLKVNLGAGMRKGVATKMVMLPKN